MSNFDFDSDGDSVDFEALTKFDVVFHDKNINDEFIRPDYLDIGTTPNSLDMTSTHSSFDLNNGGYVNDLSDEEKKWLESILISEE